MRKIHVTRQFFEASGRHGDLIEKTKNPFLDKVNGSMCANFRSVSFFVWPGDVIHIHKYTSEFKNILDRSAARLKWILISMTFSLDTQIINI